MSKYLCSLEDLLEYRCDENKKRKKHMKSDYQAGRGGRTGEPPRGDNGGMLGKG